MRQRGAAWWASCLRAPTLGPPVQARFCTVQEGGQLPRVLLPVAPQRTGQFIVGISLGTSRPAAPCSSSPLLRPPAEHLCRVKALVILVGEGPAHHLEDFLDGLPYEGVVDRGSVAQEEGRYLLAEVLVGDYRPGGGQRGTGYPCFVHKHHSLWAVLRAVAAAPGLLACLWDKLSWHIVK